MILRSDGNSHSMKLIHCWTLVLSSSCVCVFNTEMSSLTPVEQITKSGQHIEVPLSATAELNCLSSSVSGSSSPP